MAMMPQKLYQRKNISTWRKSSAYDESAVKDDLDKLEEFGCENEPHEISVVDNKTGCDHEDEGEDEDSHPLSTPEPEFGSFISVPHMNGDIRNVLESTNT